MKLSVIIPTYNRAKYITESIDSVLSQRGIDFEYEVIVADDGSEDDTLDVLKKYGDKIKIIRLKHSGKPAVVRNAAMKIARGDFIAFQDSDDLWTKDKLASQISYFDDPKVALVYGNNAYIKPDGSVIPRKRGISRSIPINGYAFMRKVSRRPAVTPAPTVIIRSSVIKNIGYFNEKLVIGTDNDYWMRVATVGEFRYCDKVLAYMRRDGSNISSLSSEAGYESVYKHETNRLEMFKHLLKELELEPEEKQALEYRIAELHFEIYEAAQKLGKKVDFDINGIKLPQKPAGLIAIDKLYEKTFTGYADKMLRLVFGWSPNLYTNIKDFLKKLVSPLRRTL